jgi:hypothetical protein
MLFGDSVYLAGLDVHELINLVISSVSLVGLVTLCMSYLFPMRASCVNLSLSLSQYI